MANRHFRASNGERNRDKVGTTQSELQLRHHALALPVRNALRHRVLHYLKGTGAVSIRTDVEGVNIYLEQYVPHHRRLIPKRLAFLGDQPLVDYPLEMGSYRLLLKKPGHCDVIYPVYIGRGEHWDGRDKNGIQRSIHMPKSGTIKSTECHVAAGWYRCGGDHIPPGLYHGGCGRMILSCSDLRF